MSKELFRISTMGAVDANDMDRLISSFVELLR